jgi:PTS system nitrogen regulatory IIA component
VAGCSLNLHAVVAGLASASAPSFLKEIQKLEGAWWSVRFWGLILFIEVAILFGYVIQPPCEALMKLTVAQVACALDLPEGKIERWIRQGRIPLARRENICTFDRQILQRWASQHNLHFQPGGKEEQECQTPAETSLIEALQKGGVYYEVNGTCPEEVFASAVGQMALISKTEKTRLVEKLVERETLASTGIGKGVAVPHPRDPESLGLQTPLVAACFLSSPIDFEALDGRPVDILFILLSPSVRTHLQLLSKLSYCLRQEAFIAFLKERPAPEALLARLAQMEPSGQEPDQRQR